MVKALIKLESNIDLSIQIIHSLCKTKQIDITLMMLDDEEKDDIKKLVSRYEKESAMESKGEIVEFILAMLD
jgi:hypothetical protein